MKSRWITHQGLQVFYLDYSNFGDNVAGLQAEMAEVGEIIGPVHPHSVLQLIDLRGTVMSRELIATLRAAGAKFTPFIRKTAIVMAVTGQRQFMAGLLGPQIGRTLPIFDDEGKALDWLTGKD